MTNNKKVLNKKKKLKAGHPEIQGETIAKFEFFDNGYNPYSRYLDIDKVDLILRKRINDKIEYIEVQVKYGKLYPQNKGWTKGLFDFCSWRFFKLDEFSYSNPNLYIAYILSYPEEGYKGDIFIFPVNIFDKMIKMTIRSEGKKGPLAKMLLAHCIQGDKKDNWYLWNKTKFKEINNNTTFDITKYRRNFNFEE